MSIGHGGLGLLSRQQSFYDLQRASDADRRPYLDLQLGKAIEGGGNWVADGSNQKTTITAAAVTWAGVLRPIVAVESMISPRPLTRVDALADMAAGTWYYDDAALVAGGSTDLYVRLPGSVDPDTTTVVLLLLFTFGTRGEVHPVFGVQRLTDPGAEIWNTGTDLANYDEQNVGATGVAITQSAIVPPWSTGRYSFQVAPGASGLAGNSSGGEAQSQQFRIGSHVFVFCSYQTAPDMPAALSAGLRVRIDNRDPLHMNADGLTTSAAAVEILLEPTWGEWRRFIFVFRCPQDTTTARLEWRLVNTLGSSQSGGYVRFDDLGARRVYRYAYYAPALSADSIPELEIVSQSHLFGPVTIGLGGISILDGYGEFAKAVAALLHFGRAADVYVGGSFRNGEEILRDNWEPQFPGMTLAPAVTDDAVSFEMEDSRTLIRPPAGTKRDRAVLPSAYRVGDLANLDKTAEGKGKPLLFGETLEQIIKATRVDVDGNGYGAYEFLDPAVPVAESVPVILPTGYAPKVYPNEELANLDQKGYELSTAITGNTVANPTVVTTAKRHGLATSDQATISGSNSTPSIDGRRTVTVTGDFTFTVAVNVTVAGTAGKIVSHADIDQSNQNTRWLIKRDVRNYQYDRAGEDVGTDASFDFALAAAPFTANLDLSGPAWKIAADLQAAMRAAAGGVTNIFVTHVESTHKFNVQKTGISALDLLPATGPNAHKESWGLLGYDTANDITGLSSGASATGDEPTFTGAESEHVIRFPGGGYQDDAAGSICGVPSVSIDSPPAVGSWLLQKVFRVPPGKVDAAGTFKSARETCRTVDFSLLFSYLKDGDGDGFAALAWLSQVGLLSFNVGGDGIWRCKKHARVTVPITSSSAANDQILTAASHGLATGDEAFISGHAGSVPDINGRRAVTVVDATHFTIGVDITTGGTGGSLVKLKGLREFGDRDYLSWRMWTDPAGVYREVRILGGYHPALGRFMTYAKAAVIDAGIPAKYGADGVLEIPGYLSRSVITGGLQLVSEYYGRLVGKNPRFVEFSTAGKLVGLAIGDQVVLSRERAFGASGALVSVPFRIIGLRHNFLAAVSRCTAVEDLDFT